MAVGILRERGPGDPARFIGIATSSGRDPRDRLSLLARAVPIRGRTILPRAYSELLAMSNVIDDSPLNRTVPSATRRVAPVIPEEKTAPMPTSMNTNAGAMRGHSVRSVGMSDIAARAAMAVVAARMAGAISVA